MRGIPKLTNRLLFNLSTSNGGANFLACSVGVFVVKNTLKEVCFKHKSAILKAEQGEHEWPTVWRGREREICPNHCVGKSDYKC